MGVWFKLFRNKLLIRTCGTIFSCEFVFNNTVCFCFVFGDMIKVPHCLKNKKYMFELRLLHCYVMKCDLISDGVTENVTIYIL